MHRSILDWLPAAAALMKVGRLYDQMKCASYYDRLRLYGRIVGPDWAFRLHDLVGGDTIEKSRPSWLAFYRDDIYALHLPLDPRAPETDKYLGSDSGAKEFAFYAAMGFDGYEAALRIPRKIFTETLSVTLGNYHLEGVAGEYLQKMRSISLGPSEYYQAYGRALDAIVEAANTLGTADSDYVSEELIEGAAAASMLFLCGGHQGCSEHIDEEEAQQTRLQTIILCTYAEALARGTVLLSPVRAKAA